MCEVARVCRAIYFIAAGICEDVVNTSVPFLRSGSKKNYYKECGNYRVISLMSDVIKVLLAVVAKRLLEVRVLTGSLDHRYDISGGQAAGNWAEGRRVPLHVLH